MSGCWRDITTVLLLLLMCFMPVACKELMGAETSISRMFSSILYIIPLSCLIASLHKRWLFITLSAIMMITSFVEMVMVLLYSNYLTAGNLLAILTTNVDEGGGFILGTLHKIPYTLPLVLVWISAIMVYRPGYRVKKSLMGGGNSIPLCLNPIYFLSTVHKMGQQYYGKVLYYPECLGASSV